MWRTCAQSGCATFAGQWLAQILFDNRTYSLGRYATQEQVHILLAASLERVYGWLM